MRAGTGARSGAPPPPPSAARAPPLPAPAAPRTRDRPPPGVRCAPGVPGSGGCARSRGAPRAAPPPPSAPYSQVGDRPAPPLHHRHALPGSGMAADGGVHGHGGVAQVPPGGRDVSAAYLARGKLGGKRLVGRVVLGHHQQPGGVAVEPVHDPRAQPPPHPGQIGDVVEERVHQRPARVAGRGVHHQAGGLVHHQQRVVLMDHREGDVLGHEVDRFGRRDLHLDALPGRDRRGLPDRPPLHEHEALLHEPGRARARQVEAAGEPRVQALGATLPDGERFAPRASVGHDSPRPAGIAHRRNGPEGRGAIRRPATRPRVPARSRRGCRRTSLPGGWCTPPAPHPPPPRPRDRLPASRPR